MRFDLKSAGLAMTALLVMPWLPVSVAAAQPSAPTIALAETSATSKLLDTAKQHFRRAEFKQAIALYQKILANPSLDRDTKAKTLTRLGEIDLWIDQTPQAEAKLQQALQLTREGNDRKGETEVLVLLGWVARSQQDYPKTSALASQALTIAQQMGDRRGEAWSYLIMGNVFYFQAQYPKALETFQAALKAAQAANDRDGMALIYNWLAITYRELKDFKQANAMSQQQQALSREVNYRPSEYDGLWTVASLQQQQKQMDQVLQTYQKQLAIAQAADNPWFQRSTLLGIGAFYVNQKQMPQALEAYQKALTLAKTIDDASVADAHNRIGVAYYRAEQYLQAMTAYQQALSIYQKANGQAETAKVWGNIGDAQSQLKQYPKALESLQQALAIYRQLKNDSDVGNVESRIGNVFYRMEEYPRAIEFYQQALVIYQKLNKPSEIAQTWLNIGNAYHWNKQYPQALDAYEQALKLYQAENRPEGIAQAQLNMGYSYVKQEQYSQAQAVFQEARDIACKIPNRSTELQAILWQGLTYVGQGISLSHAAAYKESIIAMEQAIDPLHQALTIARELKNTNSEQIAINQILIAHKQRGFAFNDQQQFTEAIAAFQQGLTFWRQNRDRLPTDEFSQEEQSTLRTLGNFYNNDGQYAKAITTYQISLQIADRRNDTEAQISLLESIASNYEHLGENAKALVASQRALTLVREKLKQKPELEMETLNKVGQILASLSQYDAALEHYQQALAIARRLKDVLSEANELDNIGNTYAERGQYLQALEFFQQALNITQTAIQTLQAGGAAVVQQLCDETAARLGKSGEQSCLYRFQISTSSILNNLAFVYSSSGRYTDALNTYEQALKIAQQYKDLALQALLLNNIGSVYLETGNYVKALAGFQQFLAIVVTSGARPRQATALNNIGQVYDNQGQTTKALDYYQQSLALAQAIQSPGIEATALHNIGSIYNTRGDYQQALAFYQQALAICRKHGLSVITELNNIAGIYSRQGRYPQALEQYQQALEIARKTGDRPQEATVLRNLGLAYLLQADYAKAQAHYQQASVLTQAMGNRASELVDLLAQGHLYFSLGQYPQALKLFQQAQILSHEFGDKGTEATAIANVAGVYRKQGQYPQALQFYQQALTLVRETGNVASESTILDRMAQTYEKQENPVQAVDVLQQALKIQRQTGAYPDEATTLNTLGRVYLAQGKLAEAQETLQQALAIAKTVNDRSTQAQALSNMGQLFAKQNQPELAIVFYKQSIKLTEDIRKGIRTLPKDQQQSYTETVADTYRQLADLLLKRDRVLEAQQVLDLLKLQELDNYLRNVRGGGQNLYELPPEQAILKKYDALNQSAIALGQELNSLQDIARSEKALTPSQEQRKVQLLKLQADLKQQFNDFATKDPDVATWLKQLSPTDIDVTIPLRDLTDFSKKLAKLDAVMLYPLVLDDRLELIITAPNAQPLRRTVHVTRQELNQTIKEFRTALQDPTRDAKPAAQKLYTWLIKPLEADLQVAKPKTIIYAPDGTLRYIPLAALHDGKQWLVERYAINNITSKSVTDFTNKPEGKLKVLAGAFGTTDQQVSFAGQSFPFSGLAFTVKEVEALAKRLPGTVELLGQAFTPTATTNKMNDVTIVHLATHASLVPEVANSFIVFGNGTATSLTDIENWTLDAVNLIVLSACETGLGGKFGKNGEEVLGLGYQFTQRGKAKAAIASLWSVNDGGTQALMDAFYANLQTGKTKAEALRQAQVTLITGKAAANGSDRSPKLVVNWQGQLPPKVINQLNHPYYWAPFILIGNGL